MEDTSSHTVPYCDYPLFKMPTEISSGRSDIAKLVIDIVSSQSDNNKITEEFNRKFPGKDMRNYADSLTESLCHDYEFFELVDGIAKKRNVSLKEYLKKEGSLPTNLIDSFLNKVDSFFDKIKKYSGAIGRTHPSSYTNFDSSFVRNAVYKYFTDNENSIRSAKNSN